MQLNRAPDVSPCNVMCNFISNSIRLRTAVPNATGGCSRPRRWSPRRWVDWIMNDWSGVKARKERERESGTGNLCAFNLAALPKRRLGDFHIWLTDIFGIFWPPSPLCPQNYGQFVHKHGLFSDLSPNIRGNTLWNKLGIILHLTLCSTFRRKLKAGTALGLVHV